MAIRRSLKRTCYNTNVRILWHCSYICTYTPIQYNPLHRLLFPSFPYTAVTLAACPCWPNCHCWKQFAPKTLRKEDSAIPFQITS